MPYYAHLSRVRRSATWRGLSRLRKPFRCERRGLQTVVKLPEWNVAAFRSQAFRPEDPIQLPRDAENLPPASQKWFGRSPLVKTPHSENRQAELDASFWSRHKEAIVPLELTSTDATGQVTFNRFEAPLAVFLDWMAAAPSSDGKSEMPEHRLYLAQCQLSSLPNAIQADLPTPKIVLESGRGDVYDTNLWIGRSPTYTPLHRDPNPNLFMQLSGRKVVRLLAPQVGKAVFEDVQHTIGRSGSASFRGEEMMRGEERALLEQEIWGEIESPVMHQYGFEANLGLGEALFIPKGWWHSIKGVGTGVIASVNWWFR